MRELASDAYIVAVVPIDSLRCTLDRIGSLSSISVSIIEVEQHFLVVPRPPLVFLLIEYFLLSFDSANYLLGIDLLVPVSEKAHSEFASPGHDAISSVCYSTGLFASRMYFHIVKLLLRSSRLIFKHYVGLFSISIL